MGQFGRFSKSTHSNLELSRQRAVPSHSSTSSQRFMPGPDPAIQPRSYRSAATISLMCAGTRAPVGSRAIRTMQASLSFD